MPISSRRPTIIDVAREAGVTRSVVSRALTGNGSVSQVARERVLAAATKLGYQPNVAAQALVGGRSKTIGALVRRVTDPSYAHLIVGLQERASSYGYRILSVTGNLDTASERAGLETLLSLRVDGIVIGSGRLSNKAITEVSQQVPTVMLWRDVPGVDVVRADERPTSEALFRHLSELGHRVVGFLSAPTQYNRGAVAKSESVRTTAAKLGIEIVAVKAGYDYEECRAATTRLLSERSDVTAVLGLSGWAAIGAMAAVDSVGLRVPDDVSVACFNSPLFDDVPQLGLTSVRQPPEDAAGLAVDLVLERIQGSDVPPQKRLITGTFRSGRTTGPVDPVRCAGA